MYCLENWARTQPQHLELLSQLYRDGCRAALISGAVAVAHGIRPYTEDTDIFTHPADYLRVAELVPDSLMTWNKQVEMRDRIGLLISFSANELVAMLGGAQIQVVQPLTPVRIAGFEYDLSHSDLVTDHMERVRVLGKTIWMTHVFDSIAMKIVYKRIKRHSDDLIDALGLARVCNPRDPYIIRRSDEIGFRQRERAALGWVGLGAPTRRSLLRIA